MTIIDSVREGLWFDDIFNTKHPERCHIYKDGEPIPKGWILVNDPNGYGNIKYVCNLEYIRTFHTDQEIQDDNLYLISWWYDGVLEGHFYKYESKYYPKQTVKEVKQITIPQQEYEDLLSVAAKYRKIKEIVGE